MSDRIFGGACIALAAFYIYFATQIEVGFMSDPLGPKAFPIIIGGIVGIAGLYPLFKPDPRPDWPAMGRVLEIVFAVAVMVAYTYALSITGFVLATAIAAALLSWRLGAALGHAAAAGLVIAVSIYLVFHLVLGLSLARGPWGF